MGHGLGNLQPWSSQQHSLQVVQWSLLLTLASQSLSPPPAVVYSFWKTGGEALENLPSFISPEV